MRWCRAALIGISMMLAVTVAPRAEAYEYTAHDLALSAQQLVEIEGALLVHHQAFEGAVPKSLTDAANGLVYSIQSMGVDGTRNWLDQVDFANATVLDQMRTIGAPVSEAVVAVMTRMPAELVKSLDTDGSARVALDPDEYVTAIADLRDRDGAPGPGRALAAPSPARTPPTSATPSSASTSGAPANTVSTATDPSSITRGSQSGAAVLGALIAAVVIIGAASFALARRRSHRRAAESLGVDHFVQLGRRINAAADVDTVWSIAVTEAIALVDATSGGERRTGQVCDMEPSLATLIDRVSDAGQSASTIVAGRHALATAVTSNGTVLGVIWVVADAPFDRTSTERLGHLVPIVATALDQAQRHESLSKLTVTDALTSLANRRRLDDDLALIDHAGVTAFVMLDIDHFKAFNDAHGHPAGDALLRQVADVLASSVRPGDVVYRYGGEEFAVLLPGASAREASIVAERLVDAVRNTAFDHGETQPLGRVTISAGVAGEAHVDGSVLRERADRALYEAKRSGRDRVVVARWGGPPEPA